MSASKLSDLLPIPSDDSEPNAYQVFGLVGCEHDAAKVTAAMKGVYHRLQKSQATADPVIWKRAAELAESARNILEDPDQRRALDRRLSAAESPALPGRVRPNQGNPGPPNDPLAALLPQSQPLPSTSQDSPNGQSSASPNHASVSSAASVLGMPPGLQTPLASVSTLTTPATTLGITSAVQPPSTPAATSETAMNAGVAVTGAGAFPAPAPWAPPKPLKKRTRKSIVPYLFTAFVVLMLGAIIGLLQFLTGGGKIALGPAGVKIDEGMEVAKPMSSVDRPRPEANPNDGIMSGVASSGIADALRPSSTDDDRGVGIGSLSESMLQGMPQSETPPATETDAVPDADPDAMTVTPPDPNATAESVPMNGTDPPSAPTAETMAAIQSQFESVEQFIRAANWAEMKPAAEALSALQLNAEQSRRADALFDIADLASFYRGAISRGLTTLSTGNTFEYVEGVPVIVVEVSADHLVIQFNKKSKSFTIDDMPPRLTEKITSFALAPERPDAVAGQALYRLIDPKTRSEYQEDTFQVLAGLDGQLEQVDTAMLVQVAKEIFAQ